MTNKDLISKLNNLKIQPDATWKQENRGVLYAQIVNSSTETKNGFIADFTETFQVFFNIVSQPVVAIAIFVLILGGGVIGITASGYISDMKPGDPLYIARTISQRAQIAVTFNKDNRNKLEVKFAKDKARDITTILAKNDIDDTRRQKLNEDFRKEINIVKEKMVDIQVPVVSQSVDKDGVIFSAGAIKDERGLEIAGLKPLPETTSSAPVVDNKTLIPEKSETLSTSTVGIIEDAEKYFDNQDYENVLNKLAEVDRIIESVDKSGTKSDLAPTNANSSNQQTGDETKAE